MRVTIAALLILALPADALAAGGGGHEPPKQTQTTKDCFKEVQWDPSIQKWVKYSQPVNGVWDPRIEKCVRPDRASSLDADTALGAVRELAYAGRQIEAQQVLAGMADQSDPLVLTYWGFTHRKLGDLHGRDLRLLIFSESSP
jgi:hypothetical protein